MFKVGDIVQYKTTCWKPFAGKRMKITKLPSSNDKLYYGELLDDIISMYTNQLKGDIISFEEFIIEPVTNSVNTKIRFKWW
jgi:hypothetical protein